MGTSTNTSQGGSNGGSNGFRNAAESLQMLEMLPAAAYTCSADGLITCFNDRALELWGRAPKLNNPSDRFCGSFRLFAPDGSAISHDECWMALALRENREFRDCEIVIEQPTGGRRFVVAYANPFHDSQGQLIGAINVLVDVTERKQMEESLRDEEARKSAILNSALDAIITMDHDGRIVDFNPAAERMFGYSAEEIAGKSLAQAIIPERLRDRHHSAMLNFLRTGVGTILDKRIEMPALRRDGSEFPAELAITVTQSPERPPFFTAYLRDLTQQKEAKRARRESEKRFASFMRHLPAAAWIKDGDGRYTYANECAQDIFQTSLDGLIGKTDLDVFPLETARQFRENDKLVLNNREAVQTVERLTHKDGVVHESIVSKFPITDEAGEIAFIGGVAIDVTVHRQAINALRRRESKLRALLDHTHACVFAKDLEGRYLVANQSVADLFGWPDGDYGIGKTDHEMLPSDVADQFVKNDRKIIEGGVPLEVEEVVEHPDGTRTFLVLKFPLRDADDKLYAVGGIASDITFRKSAEEELRNSEERYRRLAELTPVAVYTCQANSGEITYYNDQAARLWGRAPQLGETDERFCGSFRLWTPDGTLLRHEQTPMALALREGKSFRNESVIIERPDGTRIDVLVNVDPVRNSSGEIIGAINAFHDTTALTHAQEALRESEHLFRALANNAPVGIFQTDTNGDYLFVNEAWCAMAGMTPQKALGRGWTESLYPEDKDRVLHEWYFAAYTGEEFSSEHRFQRSGNTITWLQCEAVVLRDSSGQKTGYLGTVMDVTEAKLAEGILRESETRFRQLAENINELFWMSDLEENQMLYVSPAYEQIFGRTCESLYENPRSFLDAIHPDDRARVETESIDRQTRGESSDVEYRVIHPNGSVRWIRSRSFPVKDESGQVYRTVGIAEDMTERKQAQEALLDADQRKDEFLAMLAHELRNPLTPIRSGLDLLATETSGCEETITLMQEQMEHIVRLVDDLLDVSRIMRGKIELRREVVDLSHIVRRCENAIRPVFESRDQVFTCSQVPEPVLLNADPMRLTQVLENILSNASKYSDSGGRVELSTQIKGRHAVISVRDDGIGIEPDLLPKVFDLFTQSERTLDRAQGGLGIGLTLVQRLIGLHGGTVTAHSPGAGRGSTFEVLLPLATAGASVTAKPAAQTSHCSGKRILVVDDNVGVTRILTALFKKLGDHVVQAAHDGPEAVVAVREFQPDVVFLDIGLPSLDGYDVARMIRQSNDIGDVKLIALTGYGQDEDRRQSQEAGFDLHLVKPVGIDDLRAVLNDLGAGKQRDG